MSAKSEKHHRICIYPKDIERITGKSIRQSRNIITKIKQKLQKEHHQVVTIDEFCLYMGINPDQTKSQLD
jgi:thymidine kinase